MIKTIQFQSRTLGKAVDVTLIEPTTFTPEKQCYTLFALHGMTGKHSDWVDNARLDDYVADLPAVTVLPSAVDSFYVNSEIGNYETLVANELVEYVDNHYPTVKSPKGRALVGLSMGGWGSLLLALRHPETFGAAASLSGSVWFNKIEWDIADVVFGTADLASASRAEHDLVTLAKSFVTRVGETDRYKYSGPALYFDCGADDFLIDSNRLLAKNLCEDHVPYEYHEYPGAHEWVYWDRHVQDGIRFIRRELGW